MIKKETRTNDTSATLIDLLFTNRPNNISKNDVIPITFSDHDLICCVRKLNWEKHPPKEINCRDYRIYSKKRFCDELNSKDWRAVLNATNVNVAWERIRNNIRSCLDSIAPKITKLIRGKPCPWMTPDLKLEMAERDRLQRRHRKSKSKLPPHKSEYNRKRNIVNSHVKKAKQDYFKNFLLNSAKDPSSFWTNLEKIFPSKQKDPTKRFTINSVATADTNTIANAFSTFISNIVSKLKLKTYVLKNCVWRKQTFESLRTSFKNINKGIVYSELCKLKRKKSAGIDDIPPAVY